MTTIVPPAFIFEGDKNKAATYKSTALQFFYFIANQMIAGGLEQIERSKALDKNTIILVNLRKNKIYNLICGTIYINSVNPSELIIIEAPLYLESGFLALGSTALCAEATFIQPYLHFSDNTNINNYISSTTTPLEGEGFISLTSSIDSPFNGESLISPYPSKTCVGQLGKTVQDLCSNVYTSDTEIYGTISTYDCKYAQRYVPSSVYSGKLRLLVQSIYGSTRQDYYSIPLSLGNPYICDLMIDSNGESPYRLTQNTPTSGLLTTASYDYYLISANYSTFTFHKLKVSKESKKWIKKLTTHPQKTNRDFSSRVEAYILSTATIDTSFTPITRNTELSIIGTPYAYGFKFNWSGTQAKIVTHRYLEDGTQRASVITVDINPLDLTITPSVTSEESWSNGAYFQFWYPDQYDNITKTQGIVSGGYINSTGCPIYGFYDKDDVWQQFDIICNLQNSNPTSDTGNITNSNLYGNFGLDPISFSRTTIFTATASIHGYIGYSWKGDLETFPIISGVQKNTYQDCVPYFNDYTINGYTYTNNIGPVDRSGVNLMTYMINNWPRSGAKYGWYYKPTVYYYDIDTASPPGNYNVIRIPTDPNKFSAHYDGLRFNTWNRYLGYNEVAECMFAVPFSDCEAIVIGTFSGDSWNQKDSGYAYNSAALNYIRIKLNAYTPRSGVENVNDFIYFDVAQTLRANDPSFSLVIDNTSYSGANTTATIKYDSSAYSGWTHVGTDGFLIKTEAVNTSAPSGWSEKYFRVTDSFGSSYHPLMICKSSVNGANIFYHNEGIGMNVNGYPDGIYNSIGWS